MQRRTIDVAEFFGDEGGAACVDVYDGFSAEDVLREPVKAIVHPRIRMYDRVVQQRRRIAFLVTPEARGAVRGYNYSGQYIVAQDMPEAYVALLKQMNTVGGWDWNAFLINGYRPADYISAHSDNENGLASGSTPEYASSVATLSFGEQRSLIIESKAKKMPPLSVPMPHGCMLVMRGADFQRLYTHSVPTGEGNRISITARRHLTDNGPRGNVIVNDVAKMSGSQVECLDAEFLRARTNAKRDIRSFLTKR